MALHIITLTANLSRSLGCQQLCNSKYVINLSSTNTQIGGIGTPLREIGGIVIKQEKLVEKVVNHEKLVELLSDMRTRKINKHWCSRTANPSPHGFASLYTYCQSL